MCSLYLDTASDNNQVNNTFTINVSIQCGWLKEWRSSRVLVIWAGLCGNMADKMFFYITSFQTAFRAFRRGLPKPSVNYIIGLLFPQRLGGQIVELLGQVAWLVKCKTNTNVFINTVVGLFMQSPHVH